MYIYTYILWKKILPAVELQEYIFILWDGLARLSGYLSAEAATCHQYKYSCIPHQKALGPSSKDVAK